MTHLYILAYQRMPPLRVIMCVQAMADAVQPQTTTSQSVASAYKTDEDQLESSNVEPVVLQVDTAATIHHDDTSTRAVSVPNKTRRMDTSAATQPYVEEKSAYDILMQFVGVPESEGQEAGGSKNSNKGGMSSLHDNTERLPSYELRRRRRELLASHSDHHQPHSTHMR
jgi:hypothetical protein